MRALRNVGMILIVTLFAFGFSLSPAQSLVVEAQAGGNSIVYNIFATDGYVELEPGENGHDAAYIFGFVGARAGTDFEYTSSYCTGNGVDRVCAPPANVAATAVDPTAGPVQAGMEEQLAGNAQFPAPVIYAAVGDVVEIRLKNLGAAANPNAPNDPHSIHLHGLDVDAANDGVPETSLGAVGANLCADGATAGGNEDPANPASPVVPSDCSGHGGFADGAGNVVVYMFAPDHPGTYMYHCHQEANIHVNMGMYGALVVYNGDDPAYLNGGPGQGFGGMLYGVQYDKDYVLLLSEFDLRGHASEEGTYGGAYVPANSWDPDPFNWALYRPQYWFVNGLSFPQSIHASFATGYQFADWLAAHPGYDPLITGSVSQPNDWWGTPGEKVLIRVINMGFETHPMHMHGYHGKVIGSDARGWDWTYAPKSKTNKSGARPFGEGLEKQTLTVGSGETYDWLVDFGQQSFQAPSYAPSATTQQGAPLASQYPGGTQSRFYDGVSGGACETEAVALGLQLPADYGAPVSNAAVSCPPMLDNGGVEAGAPEYIAGPQVTGLVGHPGTSQFFPFHNHDDYKATNDGVYPGGMFTFLVPTQ
jgi:FtsP/CotA-like multicopper oxidase with cupredoxin domain